MENHDTLANVILEFVRKMRSKQRGLTLREMTYFVSLGSPLPPKKVAEMTKRALSVGVSKGIYVYCGGYYKLPQIRKPHVIRQHIVSARRPKTYRPKVRKPRRRPRPPREPRNAFPVPMGRRY